MGYEKVWGGGWWSRNDDTKTIVLYGESYDYGPADFRHWKLADKELMDYTFVYTPFSSLPGNVLDTSGMEWV